MLGFVKHLLYTYCVLGGFACWAVFHPGHSTVKGQMGDGILVTDSEVRRQCWTWGRAVLLRKQAEVGMGRRQLSLE